MEYLIWLITLVYLLMVIATIITVLLDNRQPSKTMAWILVLIFLPVAGIIFYFFLGQNTRKERMMSQRNLNQLTRQANAAGFRKVAPEHDRIIADLEKHLKRIRDDR